MTILFSILLTTIVQAAPQTVAVQMKNPEGKVIGTAEITSLVNGVKIRLDVKGLSPGEHALHFHETGSCQGPKFDSAGGHFTPQKTKHGFNEPGGPHIGDMANLVVGADGRAQVEVINISVSLGDSESSLLKSGGTALVIHEKADDYKSQPAGNAGARIACGVINK